VGPFCLDAINVRVAVATGHRDSEIGRAKSLTLRAAFGCLRRFAALIRDLRGRKSLTRKGRLALLDVCAATRLLRMGGL
jgi:hypothetical protein